MKSLTTFIFLFLCYQLIYSQSFDTGKNLYEQKKISEAENIFLKYADDETYAGSASYLLSGIYFKRDSIEPALTYAYKALSFFMKTDSSEMTTKSAFRIYQIHYKAQDYLTAIESANRCIELSHDADWRHLAYYNKGLSFIRISQFDSALVAFDRTYNYFIKAGNSLWISNALNQKALTYYYVGDHINARKYYHDLLDFSTENGDNKFIGNALNNLGNTYLKDNLSDSALFYFEKALDYQTNDRNLLSTHLNIAKLSDNPVPHLLIAKNKFSNLLDINAYVDVLDQLTQHHPSADSVLAYTKELASLAVKSAKQYEQVASETAKLELQYTETQLEVTRLKEEQIAQRNFYFWLLGGIILFSIALAFLLIVAYRKKWLPEWSAYKMKQLDYQVKELQKTIRQFGESK